MLFSAGKESDIFDKYICHCFIISKIDQMHLMIPIGSENFKLNMTIKLRPLYE
jgi:hypothetical protein